MPSSSGITPAARHPITLPGRSSRSMTIAQPADPKLFRPRKGEPAMADAYIYDAVRTPRGKGKADGTLHEVTALHLATTVLKAVRDRNALDTRLGDDVVFGCVTRVGEQGADIARIAVLN